MLRKKEQFIAMDFEQDAICSLPSGERAEIVAAVSEGRAIDQSTLDQIKARADAMRAAYV